MALVACGECGVKVSASAKSCPGCGAPPPKKKAGILGWVFALVIGAVVFSCQSSLDKSERAAQDREAAMTPEQKAGAEVRRKAEVMLFNARTACQVAVKKFLKDPESAKFEDDLTAPVTVDKGDIVVKMRVRAKNSMGAYTLSTMQCKGAAAGDDVQIRAVSELKS